MTLPIQDSMTLEEFDKRLEASNDRLRQEIAEAQERARGFEELLARKEAFYKRLQQIHLEIERDELEIKALENQLRPRRPTRSKSVTALTRS